MIDLFPDMDLETRAYLLLGLIGIIFFAGVLALGVGNAITNVRKAKEYESTDMHNAAKPKEAPKKTKKQKVEKPKREKKPLFKRKKEDAVEVMAIPAGYEAPADAEAEEEEEIVFTPTGFGETIDDELADDWLTGGSDSTEDDEEDENWADDDDSDWAVVEKSVASEEPEQKRSSNNPSSPFGGGVEVDF